MFLCRRKHFKNSKTDKTCRPRWTRPVCPALPWPRRPAWPGLRCRLLGFFPYNVELQGSLGLRSGLVPSPLGLERGPGCRNPGSDREPAAVRVQGLRFPQEKPCFRACPNVPVPTGESLRRARFVNTERPRPATGLAEEGALKSRATVRRQAAQAALHCSAVAGVVTDSAPQRLPGGAGTEAAPGKLIR